MTKPFHPGGAARAGLMSALMAKHGYTASARALEAPRGLVQTFSTRCDWDQITDGLPDAAGDLLSNARGAAKEARAHVRTLTGRAA